MGKAEQIPFNFDEDNKGGEEVTAEVVGPKKEETEAKPQEEKRPYPSGEEILKETRERLKKAGATDFVLGDSRIESELAEQKNKLNEFKRNRGKS